MDISQNYFARVEKLYQIENIHVMAGMNMPAQHYHDAYEIFYLVQGERNYFIKDRTYPITKGTLVFINMNELHRTTSVDVPEYERILINFKNSFISELLPGMSIDLLQCFKHSSNAFKLNVNEQAYVENLLNRMINEDKKKGFGYDVSVKTMLMELLLLIARHIHQNPADEFYNQNPLHKKVSDIVSYMNSNYRESISLHTLSKTFYMSPCYLSRIFKEVTGFNFTEYMNNVRILESKKLLRNSRLNITQIAENVGYDNATHYGRVFKYIEGISPSRYRKNS